MKLDSLQSYKKDSNMTKWLFIAVLLVTIGANVYFHKVLIDQKDKVVVVDQNNDVLFATNRSLTDEEIRYKIVDHVSDFYRLFFEFGNEVTGDNSWEVRTKKALGLIDDSGYRIFNKYKEDRLYQTVVENLFEMEIQIKEINIDLYAIPITGEIIAVNTLKRPGGEKKRYMNATFEINLNVGMESDNPHGYRIENFDIYDNSVVK